MSLAYQCFQGCVGDAAGQPATASGGNLFVQIADPDAGGARDGSWIEIPWSTIEIQIGEEVAGHLAPWRADGSRRTD